MEGQQTLQASYADLQRPYRLPAEMAKIERQNGEYLVVAQHSVTS
jgi:hypothetical protein